MARAQPDVLESLVHRLREARKEAGDRLGDVLAEATVRERAAAVAERVEDLRRELTRLLRHGEPPAQPLQDMTARELHQLATKRHIPGRGSMNKAELIDALRRA